MFIYIVQHKETKEILRIYTCGPDAIMRIRALTCKCITFQGRMNTDYPIPVSLNPPCKPE